FPVSSSFLPGPSPTSITRQGTGPSPGTVFVREAKSGHFRQDAISPASVAIARTGEPPLSLGIEGHHRVACTVHKAIQGMWDGIHRVGKYLLHEGMVELHGARMLRFK